MFTFQGLCLSTSGRVLLGLAIVRGRITFISDGLASFLIYMFFINIGCLILSGLSYGGRIGYHLLLLEVLHIFFRAYSLSASYFEMCNDRNRRNSSKGQTFLTIMLTLLPHSMANFH